MEYCERYVAEAKEEQDRTDGQDLLILLKIKQEHSREEPGAHADEPTAADKPDPDPSPPEEEVQGTLPPADMVRAAQERRPPATTAPQEVESKDGGIPQGPMFVYVGAAALFAGGMLVGLLARGAQTERDDLQESESPIRLSEIDSLDATAQDRAKTANALYLVSIMAGAAGAIWHYTSDTTAVTVAPTLGGAVLSVELP